MKAGAVCAWPVTPGAAEDVISIFQRRRVSRFPADIVDAAGDFHHLLLGFSAHRTLMLRRLDRDRDPIGTKLLQQCGIVRRKSPEFIGYASGLRDAISPPPATPQRAATGRRCQLRAPAPRAIWASGDTPRRFTLGASPPAAGAGGTSVAGITTSLRSPIPCITSGRTGRGGENRKPWPNFTS